MVRWCALERFSYALIPGRKESRAAVTNAPGPGTKEHVMGATKLRSSTSNWESLDGATDVRHDLNHPRYQAFALMRLAFPVAPIAFGLDKFFNILVDWPTFLAPWINDIVPGTGQDFMYVVGAVEILAGIIVALKPRYGAYVVAGWLAGIVINLLTYSGFSDFALRDLGLMPAALTLARLASISDPPLWLARH